MTLPTWYGGHAISVTVINGIGRGIKCHRNNSVASLHQKVDRTEPGSKRYRKLVMVRKKIQAKTRRQLRDFSHQISCKAANHVISNNIRRLIYTDVRNRAKNPQPPQRQPPSALEAVAVIKGNERALPRRKDRTEMSTFPRDSSTKTCPKCLALNRPSAR